MSSVADHGDTTTAIVGYPGFTSAWGSTGGYVAPVAPFFWTRIEFGPYLSPVRQVSGWAATMDEAKAAALA